MFALCCQLVYHEVLPVSLALGAQLCSNLVREVGEGEFGGLCCRLLVHLHLSVALIIGLFLIFLLWSEIIVSILFAKCVLIMFHLLLTLLRGLEGRVGGFVPLRVSDVLALAGGSAA